MVAAGIAAGATAMVKQNVGAYTAAGLFITIWASRLFDDRPDWRGRMKMSGQFIAGVALAGRGHGVMARRIRRRIVFV